jgi:formate hydrogenlyase subunit 3/multisubunit Na+/H+ antiporter MnhD subunit
MSAPLIWIFIPLLLATLALPFRPNRIHIYLGTLAAALSLLAFFVPVNTPFTLGSLSLKISASLQVLGRSLILERADQSLLTILYGIVALWFFGAKAAGVDHYPLPLALAIIAILIAALAVEPFLYAAIFIEIAVLLAIPLLSPPGQVPGRGVIRFLVYQTLAMPFILLAGWMLAGVEASPGDLALTIQSAAMLAVGFAFLLAVFPLYSWISRLSEETSPYVLAFLLWALPVTIIIFAMSFLDRYAWLRSPQFTLALRQAGLLMIVTGGVWAAFQRHLGRMLAYAAIVESGYMLLSLSLTPDVSSEVTFLHLIPRGLELLVWALALSILQQHNDSLRYSSLQGWIHYFPLTSAAIVLAHFSTVGFPLLAGFPPRLALWESLARQSLPDALWLLIGLLGLLIGAIRTLAVLVMAAENTPWRWNESQTQTIMLGLGILGLIGLGLFPQVMRPLLANLSLLFPHLGQ